MTRLVLIVLPMVASCALFPLTEAECKPASWREVGYAHGFSGGHMQDLRLVPECRERYGVAVDLEQYSAGWQEGHLEWDRLIGSFQGKQ
jgi:hypothetical protein